MKSIPELTNEQLARAIPARVRERVIEGKIESGDDIAALRRFVGPSQARFAQTIGISVHTLGAGSKAVAARKGPAIGLLRIAARHPHHP